MKIHKKQNFIKIISVSIACVFLASCSSYNSHPPEEAAHKVVIKRDNFGVPHIYADDTYGLYYGYGYSLAQDRMFQMEMIKRSVEGTVSEVLGEDYLDFDKSSRNLYDKNKIQAQIDQLNQEDRDILAGYADGFNKWIEKTNADPEKFLPIEFSRSNFMPSSWDAFDVAMLYVGTMAGRYSNSSSEINNLRLLQNLQKDLGEQDGRQMFDQILWISDPLAPTTVPHQKTDSSLARDIYQTSKNTESPYIYSRAHADPSPLQKLSPAVFDSLPHEQAEHLAWKGLIAPERRPTASNLWIIGPDKTTDGSTILNNGPQFGWFNPAYTYSVGLHGAGYDVTGNTPFALPVVLFGTNKTAAWGATAGPLDVNDYYQLQLDPNNPHRYLFDGAYRDMEKRTEIIPVKTADGIKEVPHDIYSSVHGVVTSFDPENNTAYAFKRSWAGHELQTLMAWVHSMKATTPEEWLAQAENVATTINWYYADKNGNIAYVSPGYLPIRPASQDIRLPALGDGSMEWLGIRPFSETPQVVNPEQGYIANWNNRSAPSDAALGDGATWGIVDRANEFFYRIEGKDQLTPEEIYQLLYETSFADTNARYFVPYIMQASQDLDAQDSLSQAATQKIKNWSMLHVDEDQDGFYDDPAVTIFREWLHVMYGNVLEGKLPASVYRDEAGYAGEAGSSTASIRPGRNSMLLYNALLGEDAGVPQHVDFFEGASEDEKLSIIRNAFQQAVANLNQRFGPDMNSWLTATAKHPFPNVNFLGIPQGDEALSLPSFMNRGTENNQVIFSKNGDVSMCTVAPPGQSGFIAQDGSKSRHYADQLEMFANFECKTEWLTEDQVDKNMESYEVIYY